jgi:hypothetical protein
LAYRHKSLQTRIYIRYSDGYFPPEPLEKTKKDSRAHGPRGILFLLVNLKAQLSLNVKNLLAVVETANLAHAVGLNHLVALGIGALNETAGLQLGVVGSSGISASLGNFTLWYCHIDTSSWVFLLSE